MREIKKEELESLKKELKKDRRNLFFLNNLSIYELGKEIRVYQVGEAYLMNWMDTALLIFAPKGYDKKEMEAFISTQKFTALNSPKEYLEPLEDYLEEDFTIDYRDFMMVDRNSFKKALPRDIRLRELFSPEDYEDLFILYRKIPLYQKDFPLDEKEEWALDRAELEYPSAGVGLYINNMLVSGAYLSGATKESAMVVGVGTDPAFENQGFGTSVVSELVDIALNENNIGYLCLWYSEEKARHLYEKLGFTPIGQYAHISRKKR